MADTRFFDHDIHRLEAGALVKAAEPSSHSQPVHDCRTLLLSDNLSIVLCFTRGRSRDFRVLTQIKRFASVCLARNTRISIRWIRSEYNSSDRGSREHDSANDPTKSLVDHLGSNGGQTFLVSHAWLCREPGSCEYEALAATDGVAINLHLLPETLSAVAEETEDSLCIELAGDETQGPEKAQPPRDGGLRESSLPAPSYPTERLRRMRPWGTMRTGGSSFVQQQRRGEGIRRSRSCLAATRDVLGCENW